MKRKTGSKIVVIGNGGAAAHAVMAMRSAGYDGSIDLVARDRNPPFNPMLIPYYLKGDIPWERCFPFGAGFYDRYRVRPHLGRPAMALDCDARMVELDDGTPIEYDRCLIATGSGCVTPGVPGLAASSRTTALRTAASAIHFEDLSRGVETAVVLGASMVGARTAEILARRGVAVTLVDMADQMLPHAAHPRSAALVKSLFEEKGVKVFLGERLQGVQDYSDGARLYFESGLKLDTQLCSACTGVRPNYDFLDTDRVEIGQAILVDRRMRTTADDVYAAGDVCQGLNRLTGRTEWMGLWCNAAYQGRIAGLNMAGRTAWDPGAVSQHVSPFFDFTFYQIGNVDREGDNIRVVSRWDAASREFYLLVFEGDRLAGANLINHRGAIGDLKSAMLRKLHWGDLMPDADDPPLAEMERRVAVLNRIRYRSSGSQAIGWGEIPAGPV